MRKKISTILILVGILMIVIPQGLKYYSRQVENKSMQKFKSELQDKSESQDEVEDNYKPGDEIAIMRVKSVGLETVIVEGTDTKYLKELLCQGKMAIFL